MTIETLTDISSDEDLIASGVYVHQSGDDILDTRERWLWHGLAAPDATRLRVQFTADAYTLLAELDYQAVRVIRLRYRSERSDGGQSVRGVYTVKGDVLHVERHIGDNTTLEETIPWSSDIIFDAPFAASKGQAIVRLAAGNSKSTFAPHLQLAERAGDLAKNQAQYISETEAGRQYRYRRLYWLDEHNIVLRVEDDTMEPAYIMDLTEYTRT